MTAEFYHRPDGKLYMRAPAGGTGGGVTGSVDVPATAEMINANPTAIGVHLPLEITPSMAADAEVRAAEKAVADAQTRLEAAKSGAADAKRIEAEKVKPVAAAPVQPAPADKMLTSATA